MEYRFPIPSNATPVCDILNKTVGKNQRVLSLLKCLIYHSPPLRFSVQQCSKGLSFSSFQQPPPPPPPQERGRREEAGLSLSLSSGVPWGDWCQFRVNSLNCRLVKETADRCRVSIEQSAPFPCAPRFNTVSRFSQLEPALSSFNSAKQIYSRV